MCFGLSTLGAGAKTRLESRIKELTPHCVCRPGIYTPKYGAFDIISPQYFLFSYHISVYMGWFRFTCVFFHTNTHTPKAVTYHEPIMNLQQ